MRGVRIDFELAAEDANRRKIVTRTELARNDGLGGNVDDLLVQRRARSKVDVEGDHLSVLWQIVQSTVKGSAAGPVSRPNWRTNIPQPIEYPLVEAAPVDSVHKAPLADSWEQLCCDEASLRHNLEGLQDRTLHNRGHSIMQSIFSLAARRHEV